MKKWIGFSIKLAVLVLVVWLVGRELVKAWSSLAQKHVPVDWRWGGIAVFGFCASMLTSGLVWRWLAWRMGDRSPTAPLLGAYTFSQMGKYVPGKVALLLMRIERAGRFGMTRVDCTLSTLLENALFVMSGAIVSMTAAVRVLNRLRTQGVITEQQQQLQWVAIVLLVAVLAVACHPAVFYGMVNLVRRRVKKAEVPPEKRLGMGTLALGVLAFFPCWVCGGLAMWASMMCVHGVDIVRCWWFGGAYALSVILGMVSLLPGGLVVRELVVGAAVTLQLSPVVGHEKAVLLGSAVAVLQRLFQIIAEVLMGAGGAAVTGLRKRVGPGGGVAAARVGETSG